LLEVKDKAEPTKQVWVLGPVAVPGASRLDLDHFIQLSDLVSDDPGLRLRGRCDAQGGEPVRVLRPVEILPAVVKLADGLGWSLQEVDAPCLAERSQALCVLDVVVLDFSRMVVVPSTDDHGLPVTNHGDEMGILEILRIQVGHGCLLMDTPGGDAKRAAPLKQESGSTKMSPTFTGGGTYLLF
jgi:hypothetical protein